MAGQHAGERVRAAGVVDVAGMVADATGPGHRLAAGVRHTVTGPQLRAHPGRGAPVLKRFRTATVQSGIIKMEAFKTT